MPDIFDEYPPSAFYFNVVIGALGVISFQEVSGIGSELQETEAVEEGGENQYVYQLPKKISYSNLVLKRGIAPFSSPLVKWCKSALEPNFALPIMPQLITVSLLNENKIPIRAWSFAHAYPVKWQVESFNSTKNEVAIETIECCYKYLERLV